MKTYTPKKPSGRSALWTWRRWIWDLLAGGLFPIAGDGNVVVQWVQGVYRISVKPMPGGGGSVSGWFWNTPTIELPAAPYPAVKKGAVIHLQPTHALVTTGIRDAANPTGPLVQSLAGSYIAMRDVPATATVGGYPVWNLPQFPLPVPTNWDDATNFWRFWPDPTGCT